MPIKEDFANSFMKGRISGFLSIFFGVASFIAVLCFLFPSYLTTPDLRKAYPVSLLRVILMVLPAILSTEVIRFAADREKPYVCTGLPWSRKREH